jgi:iron complex outermembrane receptor protein
MTIRNGILLSASALALTLAAGAAWAADQPTPVIQEVVVTANRVESVASKTPIALTAISGQSLASEQITNPTLLANVVPNLSIDRGNGLQITIRGVTSTDATEKGDPSAAFLLDGIYIARPQAQEVTFYDIDRVEVLRGPQGTLYGRNTTAGVVNVISQKPKSTYGASVDVNIGSYSARQVTGMVNLPINNVLAMRIAANYDSRDSWVTQAVPQASKLPKDKDNTSVRLSLLYTPTDRMRFLLRADYSILKGVGNGVLLSNFYQTPIVPPAAGARAVDPVYIHGSASDEQKKTFADAASPYGNENTWGVTGELNYEFSDHWSVAWLGGYRMYSRNDFGNFFFGRAYISPTLTADVVIPYTNAGNFHEESQEVRVAYTSDKLKAQAGLYYFHERYGINGFLLGLLSPTPGTPGYAFGFPQGPGENRSLAAFGQATYSLTDRWRITGGLRTTDDMKYRKGATAVHTALNQPINPATDSINDASLTTQKLTWKVGMDYDLAPATMAYFTVATGYKAGGFNDGCAAGTPNCKAPVPIAALYYQPETLTSYEVGVKTKQLDGALSLAGDYFHYDYNNLQLSQLANICGGPCQVTTNAAAAVVDGVEVEGVYALNANSRFDFGATWLDAHYKNWEVVPGVNFAGATLDRSPAVTIMAGYTYTHPLANHAKLIAKVRTRYSDKYSLLSTALRGQFWQPSFTRSEVSLSYSAPRDVWYVAAYATNLENTLAVTSVGIAAGFPGLNNGTANFSEPRTYGVRFGAKF